MDGSYLNRWASWVARWLLASLVVTVGLCSWWSTADRGGPMSAFRACAETSIRDSVPLPESRRGRQEVRCATIMVPVDYADPGRGSLDLAVIVQAADQHDRIGSLVRNPGGPGLSSLDYPPLWASWLPDALLARFEVVTFDPRGTGRSAPIRCLVLRADQATAATPHPVLPIPETITASPVPMAAAEADPATLYYGAVALAPALGPTANPLTVSSGGRTAFKRSPCVAEHVTLYLVELRVSGGHAC